MLLAFVPNGSILSKIFLFVLSGYATSVGLGLGTFHVGTGHLYYLK